MGLGHQNSRLEFATNKAASTYYYPSSSGLEVGGAVCVTVGLVMSGGVTATIEAAMQDSKRDPEDGVTRTWVDITKTFKDLNTGLDGTASFADANKILQANGLDVEFLRVKIVTSDATNSVGVWLRVM